MLELRSFFILMEISELKLKSDDAPATKSLLVNKFEIL